MIQRKLDMHSNTGGIATHSYSTATKLSNVYSTPQFSLPWLSIHFETMAWTRLATLVVARPSILRPQIAFPFFTYISLFISCFITFCNLSISARGLRTKLCILSFSATVSNGSLLDFARVIFGTSPDLALCAMTDICLLIR